MSTITPPARPQYGIDAPGLVRGFFLGGVAAVVAAAVTPLLPLGLIGTLVGVAAGVAAAYCLGMGGYMLYFSLVAKVRGREALLDLVPWRGDEATLDVGCGRGLLLVGAAVRTPGGRATGIDLWQAEDQAANDPEATMANAAAEGVAGRVEVVTGDMRDLPFAVESFDVVVSHWAVHNVYDPAERATALAEIARVVRPGGHVLLADIGHHAEYADFFRGRGFADVRHVYRPIRDAVLAVVTLGSFRPGTVVGRKPE